jgi:hypothetical protein
MSGSVTALLREPAGSAQRTALPQPGRPADLHFQRCARRRGRLQSDTRCCVRVRPPQDFQPEGFSRKLRAAMQARDGVHRTSCVQVHVERTLNDPRGKRSLVSGER